MQFAPPKGFCDFCDFHNTEVFPYLGGGRLQNFSFLFIDGRKGWQGERAIAGMRGAVDGGILLHVSTARCT